jgi:hypothetical protein
MSWNPAIPQSGDIPAQSQALILQNFQYLNTFVQGQANALLLNQQATAPTVAANQVGIYNLLSGGVNNLMIQDGPYSPTNKPVNLTTSSNNVSGWCALPCGLYMVWGTTPSITDNGNVSYTFGAGASPAFPGFSAPAYFVQVTPIYSSGISSSGTVYTSATTITHVNIYNKTGSSITTFVFAIGPM